MNFFDRDGVRFAYPDNWTVDVEDGGDGWTVTLSSPETAFALVSLRPDADTAAQVADEALAVLQGEYPDLDADPAVDALGGMPAVGHDIDFLTLDTSITCWTRCAETTAGPLLVMCQTGEFDRAKNEPVLRAVCASLTVAD